MEEGDDEVQIYGYANIYTNGRKFLRTFLGNKSDEHCFNF